MAHRDLLSSSQLLAEVLMLVAGVPTPSAAASFSFCGEDEVASDAAPPLGDGGEPAAIGRASDSVEERPNSRLRTDRRRDREGTSMLAALEGEASLLMLPLVLMDDSLEMVDSVADRLQATMQGTGEQQKALESA